MKSILLVFYAFLYGSFSWAGAAEEFSTLRADGSIITAYFQKPQGNASFPIVVVLQGSECRSIYNSALSGGKPFLALGMGLSFDQLKLIG